MPYEKIRKRFGSLSIKKGFITKAQFLEAMAVQIENELEGTEPELIGSVLFKLGYMTAEQIDEVVENIPEPGIHECTNCGVLILECPNCGANLR